MQIIRETIWSCVCRTISLWLLLLQSRNKNKDDWNEGLSVGGMEKEKL